MAGSPPNRRTHSPWLITASLASPGRSSSAPKTRPSTVPASNTGKKSADTWIAFTCSGVTPPLRFRPGPEKLYAHIAWNAWVCCFQAMNLGIDTLWPKPSRNLSCSRSRRSGWL